jgi:hypothetical protein
MVEGPRSKVEDDRRYKIEDYMFLFFDLRPSILDLNIEQVEKYSSLFWMKQIAWRQH